MKKFIDPKGLCLELARCDQEKEVINLLCHYGLWQDSSAWKNYGDTENNFSVVGNQQSRPEAALVEKIINSVDAVLMRECYLHGIDPIGPEAPSSIRIAVKKFFNIRDGKLSNIGPMERGTLAENICLVSTGAKTKPCYSIIDKGEGQSPEKFKDTFLSLGKSNKLRIPFVQGKFNQGGTGVLQFCGSHNLQLIISKRHPDIAKREGYHSKWGFTIIRRDNPSAGVRSSTYKYLAPKGEVLSFRCDFLPLTPGKYPNPYEDELQWGTFIKLYEYQMIGLKTNILFDLYNRLSLLIPSVGLPIRFYERRKGFSGHSFETTLSGLTVRLDEDRRKNLEEGFPASLNLSVLGEKMSANIFVFKRNASKHYKKNEGIVFMVNGQTHAQIAKTFFSRRSVGMGYLSESLLVLIDCTNLSGRAKEDLFMTSRDRLRSGVLKSEIERNLEEQLRNHPGLKELREKRRREDIEGKIEDSKPLADIIEKILKTSPALSKIFVEGVRLTNPFKVGRAKATDNFVGKKFPTYFTLVKKFPQEAPKCSPINQKFRVEFKTDAMNDYFDRDSEPGSFFLQMNGKNLIDYSLNLWNGIANLNISFPSGVLIGDVLLFESLVTDDSRPSSICERFYVKVLEKIDKTNGGRGGRKPPSSQKPGKEVDHPSGFALPNVIEVKRADWNRHSFREQSALKVQSNGEDGYDFFINIDNIHLLTEQKSNTSIDPKLLEVRYKYGMVLIGIALLKDFEQQSAPPMEEGKNEEDIFNRIFSFSEAISPILLPMIGSLGDLNLEEDKYNYEL